MGENLTRAEHEEFARRMTTENERLKDEDTRQNKRIEQLENTLKEQTAIGERVKKLEDRDGDMWRTSVKYVLSAVLGGLVTFFFIKLGMK